MFHVYFQENLRQQYVQVPNLKTALLHISPCSLKLSNEKTACYACPQNLITTPSQELRKTKCIVFKALRCLLEIIYHCIPIITGQNCYFPKSYNYSCALDGNFDVCECLWSVLLTSQTLKLKSSFSWTWFFFLKSNT